ncbi:hypothetical protein Tco_0697067 [Tanacetum coccineum]
MIAPGSSRYSSNDMVHNHYLEEAKKKTQESSRNSEPSVMPSARSQSIANSSKPKPRINNQKSRNWPASKLAWQPTGRILKTVCLDWIPQEDIASSTNKGTLLSTADQASVFMAMTFEQRSSSLGHQRQMTSVHISSGLILHQMTSDHNRSELGIYDHSNEPSSSKLVPKVVPLAVKTATSRQELELLFHHHIAMLRTTEHPSDTNVFTMKMEILLEPASNKLLVGDLRDSI